MNLISFSIKTKGVPNFARRLWTVFARFGFSERKIRRALFAVMGALQRYDGAPTFFIPAVVLRRHPRLMAEIAGYGAEVGIHGYVHNDYRYLSENAQLEQTKRAIDVFHGASMAYRGFRNPYLGWNEEALGVFAQLEFGYESNEAVLHNVIDVESLPAALRMGYEKSLELYQVLSCNSYALRPHFERALLRIPTSVPDDEMLFDRLRMTNAKEVGMIWRRVMQNVYDYGGLYVLNLHPERGTLCRQALDILLDYAHSRPTPIWLARLEDVADWWRERSRFRVSITEIEADVWQVEAECTDRATLLARHLIMDDGSMNGNPISRDRACTHRCVVRSKQYPCIGLAMQTPQEVLDFLYEQGYPAVYCSEKEARGYALYLDMPQGLGTTREERFRQCNELVERIEGLEAPFLHFASWPKDYRAALSITGDIDSITIQDFFLRIFEVAK